MSAYPWDSLILSPWLEAFVMPPDEAPATISEMPSKPDAQLFKLATRPPHKWGRQYHVAAVHSLSRHEQFEWHCEACHLVRITVIPKGCDARREYRRAGDCQQFEADREPWCEPMLVEREKVPTE